VALATASRKIASDQNESASVENVDALQNLFFQENPNTFSIPLISNISTPEATSSKHEENIASNTLGFDYEKNSDDNESNVNFDDDMNCRYSDSEADSIPDVDEQDYMDIDQINKVF